MRPARLPVRFGTFLFPMLLLFTGCASQAVRFSDGPVVVRVADDSDIGEVAEREWWRQRHQMINFGRRQMRLRLDPVPAGPANDVNRLGDVPSSSWFENRIVDLTPEQVARGAGGDDRGPEPYKPWTIKGVKVGGRNPGFLFADSRGVRYICKFDKVGSPVIATSAGAVANRLLWAAGYHTPDDRIVFFERSDLVIPEQAKAEDRDGRKKPLTGPDIDALLASVPAAVPGGGYRALVSRFLPGKPVGGYAYRGTRSDDPNDTIPHQERRSLRALRIFGAWINHVDLKWDNTLDVYLEEEDRRFVQHYLVDFDGCLGGYWAARHEARIGHAYDVDLGEFIEGIPLLGLFPRGYERLQGPGHKYVGLFEGETYDPAEWKANYLNDQVDACRPADTFWAGTIIGQFSRAHLESAVSAARYDDPEAERLLVDILETRRRKTLAWALTRVTPVVGIGDPVYSNGKWSFPAVDALIHFGLDSEWRYDVLLLDGDGRRLAPPVRERTDRRRLFPSRPSGTSITSWFAGPRRTGMETGSRPPMPTTPGRRTGGSWSESSATASSPGGAWRQEQRR